METKQKLSIITVPNSSSKAVESEPPYGELISVVVVFSYKTTVPFAPAENKNK